MSGMGIGTSGTAESVAVPFYAPTGNEVALFEHAHRNRLALLLKGPTGCGKTRFVAHKLFAVTVDEQGRDYLPYIFGPGAYAIFPHVARLPAALPAIYRQLTG